MFNFRAGYIYLEDCAWTMRDLCFSVVTIPRRYGDLFKRRWLCYNEGERHEFFPAI